MEQGATGASTRRKRPTVVRRGSRKGVKVLVVDDDPHVLLPTAAMFNVMGYETFSAGSGVEALSVIKAHPGIRVLVTEALMDQMDGVTLAREVRDLIPEIKVILVSEFPTSTADFDIGLPEEGFHFLFKPLLLSEVSIVLRR